MLTLHVYSFKGVYACLFCAFQKYGYTHLSAGDLLRDERKRPGSQYGELIENYIKEGEIVPVEITISLIKRVRKGLFPTDSLVQTKQQSSGCVLEELCFLSVSNMKWQTHRCTSCTGLFLAITHVSFWLVGGLLIPGDLWEWIILI